MTAMLLAAAFVTTVYLGFVLLALSQDRHWHDLGGARYCPLPLRTALRIAGGALVVAGLPLAVLRDGAGFGALLWVTGLSACAFAVVGTLTWRRQWLSPLARLLRRYA